MQILKVVNLLTFPVLHVSRGTVIGILKALLGLSASAYTTIYVAFMEPDAVKFLLLLAIGPSVVALLSIPFINFVPFIQVEPHTKVGLRWAK